MTSSIYYCQAEKSQLSNEMTFLIEILEEHLSSDWEIYIYPFLNGLKPEIVLLSELKGVQIINFPKDRLPPKPRLNITCKEIYELYSPVDKNTSIEIFRKSFADLTKEQKELLVQHNEMKEKDFTFISKTNTNKTDIQIKDLVPFALKKNNKMTSVIAENLRTWLRPSDYILENREEISELDRKQKQLVTSKSPNGYRRIKGSAGSGKTLVLAHKAALLSLEGKNVLFLTYNITLINYIMSLIQRAKKKHTNSLNKTSKKFPEILNFHSFAKRGIEMSGHSYAYRGLWRFKYDKNLEEEQIDKKTGEVLNYALPETFLNYINKKNKNELIYDAVLVDEGQDFQPLWWECCRKVLKSDGEAFLVKDDTQDIYGTGKKWTDDVMKDSGFTGKWSSLNESYRLPQNYVPVIKSFIDTYMNNDKSITIPINSLDEPETIDFFEEVNKNWINTEEDLLKDKTVDVILKDLPLTKEFSYSNILLLTLTNASGLDVIHELEKRKIKTVHTYNNTRQSKTNFNVLNAKVKGTTIHSFKGLESPMIVLQISPIRSDKDGKALKSREQQNKVIYTALTRLRMGMNSKSYISVICADKYYENFSKAFN